jgi:hypothetical protein
VADKVGTLAALERALDLHALPEGRARDQLAIADRRQQRDGVLPVEEAGALAKRDCVAGQVAQCGARAHVLRDGHEEPAWLQDSGAGTVDRAHRIEVGASARVAEPVGLDGARGRVGSPSSRSAATEQFFATNRFAVRSLIWSSVIVRPIDRSIYR